MKIESMMNVNWEKSPKIRATLTLELNDGFKIKECKLIESIKGFFVASPSKPCKPWTKTLKDGTTREVSYDDLVYIPTEARATINELAGNMYDATVPNYTRYNGDGAFKGTGTTKTTAVAVDEDIPF
jgi:DNA-binding cell septation regulator SpoVG